MDDAAFRKELSKDLKMGLAIALSVAITQIVDAANPLRRLGLELAPVAFSAMNAFLAVFVGSFLRMLINDAAPPSADRQEMKAFLFMILMMVAAFMLKAFVHPLNAFAVSLSGATAYGACILVHVVVAVVAGGVAHFSAFLPTDSPAKRSVWYSLDVRCYGLHLCAIWNAALGLPLGFAWDLIKNDLLALIPLPVTSSRLFIMFAINLLLVVLLAVTKCFSAVRRPPSAVRRLPSTRHHQASVSGRRFPFCACFQVTPHQDERE